jgi:molybdate transport system substrate-binding protein
MDWLQKRGRIAAETRVDLLGNRLAFIMGDEHTEFMKVNAENPWAHLTKARIAVADTVSVPAGIYARQSLENLGWWEKPEIQSALVQASSVREALTWVMRGEAGFGIVYSSDAKSAPHLSTMLIEERHHDPIHYPAAVVADNDSPSARRLLACLQGKEASDIFGKYGFTVLAR